VNAGCAQALPRQEQVGQQVATMAFDSSDAPDASRPPISLHPAFPAVVALWFAALLGIGSMVLPVVLLERVVGISGLAALVPGAAPPLGSTARILIALAAATVGALGGLAIARRVAGAHGGERASFASRFASGARRPIDVNEEIGGEALVNGRGLPVDNRRAQAIADDAFENDDLYMAPLPEGDAGGHLAAFEEHPDTDEPHELGGAFAQPAVFEALPFDDEPEPFDRDADDPMALAQPIQPLAPRAAPERQEFKAGQGDAYAEPLAFSPPSLARRASQAEPELAPAEARAQPVRSDWPNAPAGDPGLVQLVQRLGRSLERRRELLAATTAAPAPLREAAESFDPAPAEEAAEAIAAYFGRPAAGAAPASSGERPDGEPTPAPPAAPADTDAALRAALVTLQRMSGAA
jgi:hypothetical protein